MAYERIYGIKMNLICHNSRERRQKPPEQETNKKYFWNCAKIDFLFSFLLFIQMLRPTFR